MRLFLDCETFSRADLEKVGTYNYWDHPSTGVHCIAYAFDDAPVEVIVGDRGFPDDLEDHIRDGGEIWAHNAVFEYLMLHKLGLKVALSQMHCTMATGLAMGLPGSLENMAAALGLDMQKDTMGARVMLQLATPKPDGSMWTFEDAPDKFNRMYQYCKRDVEVMQDLVKRLRPLSAAERRVWLLDQEMNLRGVAVDRPAVAQALRISAQETRRLDEAMALVTGGKVPDIRARNELSKFLGVKSVAKDALLDWKGDGPAAEAVKIRQEAARSSVAKLKPMLEKCCADGRIRGLAQYHSARTGRWAGRGVQHQNFPRGTLHLKAEEQEFILNNLDILSIVTKYPPLSVISDCLRGMFVAAPGHEFHAVDFTSIEARVLAWLAGDEGYLEVFRTHGKVYEYEAGLIYGVPMKEIVKGDDRRQIGKVAVLALGYQGGHRAFATMGVNYGVKVPEPKAKDIVTRWRAAHPLITQLWQAYEDAAMDAVVHGAKRSVGRCTFFVQGSFLVCVLPSKRWMVYPYPKIEQKLTPWGEMKDVITYMAVDSLTRRWVRESTYGGKITENIDQAVARDCLAAGMLRVDMAGIPLVMTVHDEVVTETPIGEVPWQLVADLLTTVPSWAPGLPLSASGWTGRRYRKE